MCRARFSTRTDAVLLVYGGELEQPIMTRTNQVGYYVIPELEVGFTYAVTVAAKGYKFANAMHVLPLNDSVADLDFIAERDQTPTRLGATKKK